MSINDNVTNNDESIKRINDYSNNHNEDNNSIDNDDNLC